MINAPKFNNMHLDIFNSTPLNKRYLTRGLHY